MKKADSILDRMTEYFDKKGAPVTVEHRNKGYSIIHESGEPVARFRLMTNNPDNVEVLWWSHRNKWDHIGDFGGMRKGLDEALDFVLSDPMGIFWKGQDRGITSASKRTDGKRRLLASLSRLFGEGR
jgi:hypothetical protein